jgi:glucose/arabinose dehydrogenase
MMDVHQSFSTASVAPLNPTPTGLDSHSVIFVDSRLKDLEQTLAGVHSAQVVVLDANQDGIRQITQTLQQQTNISSIHILSHGSAGTLQLGNAWLNGNSLNAYSSQIRSWQSALTTQADILLYGCDVAAGTVGQLFVSQLSQITGADVASSINATGSATLGGDWDLESQTGTIQAAGLVLQHYQGLLPIYNGNNYVLTNGAKTWEDAQAEAKSLGGNLVAINTAAEETWLKQTFGSSELFWIGLTDKATEGNFQWISGELSTYRNWSPGEPNNALFVPEGEDYAVMNWGGQWNDLPNSVYGTYRGIIEIPTTPSFTYNGNTYRLTNGAKTWEDAQAEAKSLGGNLVAINTAAEETWLKQTFGSSELFWIGLTDKATEGNFQWISGELSTYRNWSPGEPNNALFVPEGEDYAVMNWGGQWNDLPNSVYGTYRGIIEIPTTPSFTYNGNTYRLTNGAKTWEDAQAEAKSLGGNLVAINTAAEETWLKQTFGSSELLWIGLTDKVTEGNFQWSSGEAVTYTNWSPGEPNDFKFDGNFLGGEDYAVMNWGGQWNDLPNNFYGTYRGIIEIPDVPGAIRINAGGGAYLDKLGRIWQADQFFVGGNLYSTGAEILKTDDDPLYQTERWANNLQYAIPVNNGTYRVNLHFAEIALNDFNQRIFDVSVEGQLVADDLDIFARSKNAFFPGNNSALVISTPFIRVTDGVLNLNMQASNNNAKISAIEIIPILNPIVLIEPTGSNTTVTEGGTGDTYTAVLNTQPTANVTVNLQPSNQINLNQSSITFTPNNWNQPQTIAISAVNDTAKEGTQEVTINHTVSSADPTYNGLGVDALAVRVIDDEVPPISFAQKTVATIGAPTTAAWGPDGRLYVGTYSGEIQVYTFDNNYNVTAVQTINTIKNLSNPNILGIAFNPYDTSSSPTIYITHSKLFANGGASFPTNVLAPYSGQVSLLEGSSNFATLKPLITGLPVSHFDHGINGMTFDNKGDLYIAIGGNTNAGIINTGGGLPESPLTATVLKAEISKLNFNGKIEYQLPSTFVPPTGITFDPAQSQVFGNLANVKAGVDVSIFATGLRNPYDVVWTTKGQVYATDNGPNGGFGDESTGANTQQPATGAQDELNLLTPGNYYGHPNRNRGLTDSRQNVYYNPSLASIPGVYTAPLTIFPSSTNGIDEYRATTFGGQLLGNLITQQLNGPVFSVTLSANGTQVAKSETLTGIADGLDIVTAPGGALVGIDLADNRVTVATPNDLVGTTVTAYDVFPWRAPAVGGNRFVIGGQNFGNLSNTTVTIGGQPVSLTQVTSNQLVGILPSLPAGVFLDVVVSSKGQTSELKQAFLPLSGSSQFV